MEIIAPLFTTFQCRIRKEKRCDYLQKFVLKRLDVIVLFYSSRSGDSNGIIIYAPRSTNIWR